MAALPPGGRFRAPTHLPASSAARWVSGPERTVWLRRCDGDDFWKIRFDGAGVVSHDGPCEVELTGTASDLMLFLWRRISADAAAGAGRFTVRGDASLLDRHFVLVPPV